MPTTDNVIINLPTAVNLPTTDDPTIISRDYNCPIMMALLNHVIIISIIGGR